MLITLLTIFVYVFPVLLDINIVDQRLQ